MLHHAIPISMGGCKNVFVLNGKESGFQEINFNVADLTKLKYEKKEKMKKPKWHYLFQFVYCSTYRTCTKGCIYLSATIGLKSSWKQNRLFVIHWSKINLKVKAHTPNIAWLESFDWNSSKINQRPALITVYNQRLEFSVEFSHQYLIIVEISHQLEIIVEISHQLQIIVEISHQLQTIVDISHQLQMILKITLQHFAIVEIPSILII